jgi:hypothetical protein
MADVGDPLLRELAVFLGVRQVVADDAMWTHEISDWFDGKAFILRNSNPSNIFTFNSFLLARYEVFEEVDSNIL